MYDFLNRIHVCGWSAAHVVRCVSLACLFFLSLASSAFAGPVCTPQEESIAIANWNANKPPAFSHCTATTVTHDDYGDGVVYHFIAGDCGSGIQGLASLQCTGPVCVAQNDVGTLYANFLTVPYEPSTALGNAASMSAITSAYWALPDQLTVCYSGCAHDLIPNASAPGDVYYSGSGPFVLHREYSADRSNVSCAGPGTGGTNSQGVVTASAVVSAATSSGTGTGTGTGSSGSCAPGDTRAACAELTTEPLEPIPSVTVNIGAFTPETQHFGGGRCPANVFMTFHGVNKNLKVWDWQQTCATLETYIKPLVLLMGAISAFFIVLGISAPLQTPQGGT